MSFLTTCTKLTGAWEPILNNKSNVSFFQPFKSGTDAACSVASVITAPVLLTSVSAFALISLSKQLLKATGNAVTGNYEEANKNIKAAGGDVLFCAFFLISALISSFINLISLIGRAINTAVGSDNYQGESKPFGM